MPPHKQQLLPWKSFPPRQVLLFLPFQGLLGGMERRLLLLPRSEDLKMMMHFIYNYNLVLLCIPLYHSCCWRGCRGGGEVCAVALLRGPPGEIRINVRGRKMDGALVGGSVTPQSRSCSSLQKPRSRAVAEPEDALPAPRWQPQPPCRRPRGVALVGRCKSNKSLAAAAARL